MRDQDVRNALHQRVLVKDHEDPDTLVLDELGLWHGAARVDVAVINGLIHGFEIKSDRDTLERLPRQAEVYNNVLDKVTIVSGVRHVGRIAKSVPEWWGLMVAACDQCGTINVEEQRPARANPEINPVAMAALLWRDEALSILETNGAARGVRSKSREAIYERLVETINLDCLREIIRRQLQNRRDWRAA